MTASDGWTSRQKAAVVVVRMVRMGGRVDTEEGGEWVLSVTGP